MAVSHLRQLIRGLVTLGEPLIDFGPKHYAAPNPSLQPEIDAFFEMYPALGRDAGYVEFLEVYSAAVVEKYESLIVEIYGFSHEIATHVAHPDESLIEDGDFFRFAEILLLGKDDRGIGIGLGFSFDLTGRRPSGVYRSIDQDGKQTPHEWYCSTFLEWLEQVVQKKGDLR